MNKTNGMESTKKQSKLINPKTVATQFDLWL